MNTPTAHPPIFRVLGEWLEALRLPPDHGNAPQPPPADMSDMSDMPLESDLHGDLTRTHIAHLKRERSGLRDAVIRDGSGIS